MKRLLLLLLVLFVLPAGTVLASDTSDAHYYGVIRVTNNGTATSNVATVITGINTTSLINGGFLAANASDVSILHSGSDIQFMPGYGTYPWCVFVTAINADTNYNDLLYTPNVTGGNIKIFCDHMTTPDDPSIEFGGNFTLTFPTININTDNGADKPIFYKEDAFDIFVSETVSGDVTATIHAPVANETLRPNGAGDETNIDLVNGAATHWQAVNDDSDATWVYNNSVAYQRDLYALANKTYTAKISSVVVYFRIRTVTAGAIASAKPAIKIGGTVYDGTEQTNNTETYSTKSQTYNVSPATGIEWTISEIDNMQIGVSLKTSNASYFALCADVWVVVNYSDTSVTVSGLASGEYNLTASADGTDFELDFGVTSNTTTLNGVSVLDNANDLITGSIVSVMYFGSQEITIGGVQKQYIDWDYGSTFTDQSGTGNDATPTFRTTSSDADVSAELLSFRPVAESTAPSYSVSNAVDFITDTPTITGNFSTTVAPTLPGSDIIEDTSESSNTPPQLPFILLSSCGLLVISFTTSYLTRRSNSQSIIPKIIIVLAIASMLVGVKVFDFWMILYLGIMAIAFGMAKTHTTWGGEAGYNMVGFLCMSFIGMTIINRIMEGAFITSTDVNILNNVLIFRPVSVFGLFQISVPNISFLSEGIPHLIRWDYSFFGGNAVIIQYLLYSITGFMAFLLFVLMLGVVFNMLSRSR